MKQKRVAAIHDISGFGKCSLTVALPVLSAAGIETAVLPTSVLSTHTGGFTGYTFRDLTDDIPAFTDHWKSIDIKFDAIYTGYLGSIKQVDMVMRFIDLLGDENTKVVIDPAMADNGKLYYGFPDDFPKAMAKLCRKADFVVPNITEACMMTGMEYKTGPYEKDYIENLIFALKELGADNIVLTGVYFKEGELGAACYDGKEVSYVMRERITQLFHGTGDVFASAFTAAYLNNKSLCDSVKVAVDFTVGSIIKTVENNPEKKYGVNFEQQIPELIADLGL